MRRSSRRTRSARCRAAAATTPLAGQPVTVRGVVVGDVPGLLRLLPAGRRRRRRRRPPPTASSCSAPVAVDLGDTVAVDRARPRSSAARPRSAPAPTPRSAPTARPTTCRTRPPLDLPAGDAERERLEGMLVEPVDALTVSEVFDLTSFGELTLSEGGLLVQPTELARPGPEAQAIAAENLRRRIVLDDGVSARVERRPPGRTCRRTTPVRVGDELTFTEPLVLGYGFNAWRLQPADGTADGVFAPQNTRPAAPGAGRRRPAGGCLQRAQLLPHLDRRRTPAGRGSAEEFDRAGRQDRAGDRGARRRGRHAAWRSRTPTPPASRPGNADTALADLVDRLNAAAGAEQVGLRAAARRAVRRRPGRDPQRDHLPAAAWCSRSATRSAWSTRRSGSTPASRSPRPSPRDGDAFTVVANHFKSKSPGTPRRPATTWTPATARAPGTATGSGRRRRWPRSPTSWSSRAGDPDVLLLGDFNAYTQEDPIERLRDAGLRRPRRAARPRPLQLRLRRPVRLARPRPGHAAAGRARSPT